VQRPPDGGRGAIREQSGAPGEEPGAALSLPLSGEHNRAEEESHPNHETSNDEHKGNPPANPVTAECPRAKSADIGMPAIGVAGPSASHP